MPALPLHLERRLRPWFARMRYAILDRWLALRHRSFMKAPLRALPPLLGELPGPGAEPVVFCGVDPNYLKMFAGFLAESLARSSATARLHLHLYGEPDAAVQAQLADLTLRLGPGRLTHSTEVWDPVRWPGRRRILYFQSVRFARLLQLSEQTGLAFLAVDADVLFLGPFAELTQLCAGKDVAARYFPNRPDPGRKIRGAAIFVAPTAAGRSFLQLAGRRMLLYLHHGPRDRYLDQRSLYFAMKASPQIRFSPFPDTVLSRDTATALLYSAPGQAKHNDLPNIARAHLGSGSAAAATPSLPRSAE